MNWRNEYKEKLVSLEEAAKYIKSGDSVWVSPCSAFNIDLTNKLIERYEEIILKWLLTQWYILLRKQDTFNNQVMK